MQRNYVDSSNLVSVGWENGFLEVEFRDDSVYQYSNVPKHVYQGLMSAYSKGSYFRDYIRDVYPYLKVA